MKLFNDDSPLYLQLRRHIEERILERHLKDDQAIPSLRIMARDYSINPITVANALSALIEEGILYKKRGVGIFVASGAREKIIKDRGQSFLTDELSPALDKARQLDIPKQEVMELIERTYGGKDA